MEAVEILEAARTKLAPPDRWTQGRIARDKNGREVDSCDPTAVCWCAGGAVDLYRGHEGFQSAFFALNNAARRDGRKAGQAWGQDDGTTSAIARANDHESGDRSADHARVLAIFDRAIRAERKRRHRAG